MHTQEYSDIDQTRRSLEFFDKSGLQRLTGINVEDKACEYIVLQSIHNAFDKGNVSNIGISAEVRGNAVVLNIADDGSESFLDGLDPREAKSALAIQKFFSDKFLNFDEAPSSKRDRKRLTRGLLGNGFQCSTGISSTLWGNDNRPEYTVQIISNATRIRVSASREGNGIRKNVLCEFLSPVAEQDVGKTIISFSIPAEYRKQAEEIIPFVNRAALVNRHVNIKYEIDGNVVFSQKADVGIDDPFAKWKGKACRGNIHCFGLQEFVDAAKAESKKNRGALNFLCTFDLLRNNTQARPVLEEAGIVPSTLLRDVNESQLGRLYSAAKSGCAEPSEESIPLLKKSFFTKLSSGKFHRYRSERGVTKDRKTGALTPWAFEIATFYSDLPELNEYINFGYAGSNRPFSSKAYRKENGKLTDINGLMQTTTLSVFIHAVSPNFRYEDSAKGSLDVSPFASVFPGALEYVFGGSKKRFVNPSSQLSILREVIRQRYNALLKDPSILIWNKWTQSTVFYFGRKLSQKFKVSLNRKYYTDQIRDECAKLGVTREELGITAAVRAQIFFDGSWADVSIREIEKLAEDGTDLLIVEKEGVAEILSTFDKEGIAILNSRGFLVEYAKELARIAKQKGATLRSLRIWMHQGF